MIILNEKKFAESEEEFTNSLFQKGGTCHGFEKRYKRQIKIFNEQKEIIAVINKFGCICKATKQKDGKIWYSYGDTIIESEYHHDLMKRQDDIRNLSKSHEYKNYEVVHCFK